MNKVSRLGMLFNEGHIPDFGSIQMKSNNTNIYYLPAQDIPKLNGMLTKATARSYLSEGESFNLPTGALAYVVDYKNAGSGKIYAYHRGKDHWYEFNIRSDLGLFDLMWNRHERIFRETKTISGTPPLTFKSNGRPLKNYRIYGNTINGESVGDLVTEGEHAGEYCVPVTITNGSETQITNIYFPEQIRKVGDEVEFIDYKKQKQYRVRKNLLQNAAISKTINGVTFTVNNDGSITCNGTANSNIFYRIGNAPINETFIINGCPENGSISKYMLRIVIDSTSAVYGLDTGEGADYNVNAKSRCEIRIASGYTCDNLTFYPMIRKANIEDDTYDPYIEDTVLDVILPTLPYLSGTNILSVGTSVTASAIEIRGNING